MLSLEFLAGVPRGRSLMKKLAFLLSVAMILGVVALIAPTEVQAQGVAHPVSWTNQRPNQAASSCGFLRTSAGVR